MAHFREGLRSMRSTAVILLRECVLMAAFTWGLGAQENIQDTLREARQLSNEGHYADAHTKLADALRMAQAGADNRAIAIVLDEMGVDETDMGDYGKAENSFDHGLSTFRPSNPKDHLLISLQTHLAELYLAEARVEGAETMLRHIVETLRSDSHPDPVTLARAYEGLAVSRIMQKKYDEPETLLRQSQALMEAALGTMHPRLMSGLFAYAALLESEHKYAEAVAPMERALQILTTTTLPVAKPDMVTGYSGLSTVYFHAGRLQESVSYARQAVDLAESTLGPAHPAVARCLNNYAYILKHTRRKNEAKAAEKRAEEIMKRLPATASGGNSVSISALR
jgi:tetratricopeptide (TPR) repeat protein